MVCLSLGQFSKGVESENHITVVHTFQTGTLTAPDHTVTGIVVKKRRKPFQRAAVSTLLHLQPLTHITPFLPAFLPSSLRYPSQLQSGTEGRREQEIVACNHLFKFRSAKELQVTLGSQEAEGGE